MLDQIHMIESKEETKNNRLKRSSKIGGIEFDNNEMGSIMFPNQK